MKTIEFVCDRCGNGIDLEQIYTIVPIRIDSVYEDLLPDMPEEVAKSAEQVTQNKHLCQQCVCKALDRAFRSPAKVNLDFEDAVFGKEQKKPASERTGTSEKCHLTETELRDLVNKGLSVKEIAAQGGYKPGQIYRKLKRYKIELQKRISDPEDDAAPVSEAKPAADLKKAEKKLMPEDVRRAYFSGKTIPEVAVQFGVSAQTMRQFMIKNRISKNAKEYAGYMQQHGRVEDMGM